MKAQFLISLLLLPHLAPALGATLANPKDDGFRTRKRVIEDDTVGELGNFKTFARGVKAAEGEVPEKFARGSEAESEIDSEHASPHKIGDIMPTCAKADCKKHYFMDEALRSVKQALKDIGVVVQEHPAAATAIVIGVSVLLGELATGGALVPAVLGAIGFGTKGPTKNTIAAALQSKMNPVQLGSFFSQLQSAAMNGATRARLENMAKELAVLLIGAGAIGVASDSIKTIGQSSDFDPREWRTWELESRIEVPSDVSSKVAQFWEAPKARGCVAHGYQEFRARLWFVPEGMDPLNVCARTPASINGIGYKTPLGCIDGGPKEGVVGIWYVSTSGTQCLPRWNAFENEGCVLYSQRRRFARLMGLKNNDDWNTMCESTPATIDGEHYDGPDYCEDKGIGGIYGVFNIADAQCECSCLHE